MKPFEKHYAFGFMTIIHPSGITQKIGIGKLESDLQIIAQEQKEIAAKRTECIDDIAKISSRNRVTRYFIKRNINRKKVINDGKAET